MIRVKVGRRRRKKKLLLLGWKVHVRNFSSIDRE